MWFKTRSLAHKAVSIVLSASMITSAVSYLIPAVANASVVVGRSGAISANGIQLGQAGGVDNLQSVAFRVGVSDNPSFYNNGTPQDATKIATAWNHSYPNLDQLSQSGALTFLPNSYNPSSYELGYYNPSSRQISEYNDKQHLNTVIHLPSTTTQTLPLKSWLGNYSFSGDNGKKKFSSLVGKWESQASNIPLQQAESVWSYIFQITGVTSSGNKQYDVSGHINSLVSQYASQSDLSKLSPSDKQDIMRGYIALLMDTWRIVPQPFKSVWQNKIDQYLEYRNQTSTGTPTSMVIDTVTSIMWTSQPTRLLIPTVDYYQYYAGLGSAYTLYNSHSGITPSSTYNIMKEAAQGDLSASPDTTRLSNVWNPNNAFTWGSSAIAYPFARFETLKGTAGWESNHIESAIMNSLTLGTTSNGNTIRGFVDINYDLARSPQIGDMTLTASPKNKIVPADSNMIGQPVQITLDSVPSKMLTNEWNGILTGSSAPSSVNVQVQLNRTSSPSVGGTPTYSSPYSGITSPSGYNMSPTQFLNFIKGNKAIDITDDVSNYPIANNQTQTFTYNATVTVTYTGSDGSKQTMVVPSKTQSPLTDTASFVRPSNPPDYINYTSSPSAYAELKNNVPDQENFDAMAGVPSNKQLYIGVGGSEFIVDIELQYMQDVSSVWRTYKSYFSGTPSQYMKVGQDIPPDTTIGGQTVSLYNGGTYTKTWSGSIPNLDHTTVTVHGSGSATATAPAEPDYTKYNADLQKAQQYVQQVNSTTKSFTAASDHVTRTQTGWNASITTNDKNPPRTVTDHKTNYTYKTVGSGKKKHTVRISHPVTASASPSGPGTFSITVTFIVPRDIISGPDSRNVMPGVEDNWEQRVKFDYMRIDKVQVYKIESGRITNVSNLFGSGTPTLKATIQQGDPNIFYNIAQQNAGGNLTAAQSSADGRIRYSLAPQQNDTVVWYDGTRSNTSDGMGINDATVAPTSGGMAPHAGGHTRAWGKGDLYTRTTPSTSPTADQPSGGTKTGYSSTADSIDAQTPEWQTFNKQRQQLNTATIISDSLILQTSSGDQSVIYFDKNSNTVQSQQQFNYVQASQQEMWNNNPNSAANWDKNQINIGSYNGNYKDTGYGAANNKKYWGYNRATGQFFADTSPATTHHVATAFDQQGDSNFSPSHSEYWHAGGSAGSGYFSNSGPFTNGAGADESFIRPSRPDKTYIYGTHAIVPTIPNGAYTTGNADVFFKNILSWQAPSTSLRPFIYNSQSQPNYDNQNGLVLNAPYSDSIPKVNNVVIHTPVSTQDAMVVALPKSLDQRTATPPGGAAALINQQNVDNNNSSNNQPLPNFTPAVTDHITDVSSGNMAKHVTTTTDTKKTTTVTTKTTAPPSTPVHKTFSYTGNVQTFTAPESGDYTFQVWGAQGGSWTSSQDVGGAGGYATGKYHLNQGQTVYIYVGGNGTNHYGYNGGGKGNTSGYGGGATDIRTASTGQPSGYLQDRIIVAGGGGGHDISSGTAGVGGGLSGTAGVGGNASGSAGTQYSAGDGGGFGYGGEGITNDSVGGGGGWYGGGASLGDSNGWGNGGGGSSYIGDLTDGQTLSGNQSMPSPSGGTEIGQSGDGYAIVSYQPSVSVGTPKVFNYTGGVQTYTASESGTYKLQVWGASGGNDGGGGKGGLGGYSEGSINLNKGQTVYVYVGQVGGTDPGGVHNIATYNGGGASDGNAGAGGGATDIRTQSNGDWQSYLGSRVIVAGGGGGGGWYYNGGAGGGVSGLSGTDSRAPLATQTSGASFGIGSGGNYGGEAGGGGGGYYGGYEGGADSGGSEPGGGGGSGYIGGVTNGVTYSGVDSMPSPTVSGSNEYGNSGNGVAIITPIKLQSSGTVNVPVQGSSFETPSMGNYNWQYQSGGHVGTSPWTFGGSSGIQANYSSWSDGTVDAPDGNQTAFLQETGSSIAQSVNFQNGGTYKLSFQLSARPGYGGQPLEIYVDGTALQQVPTPTVGFSSFTSSSFTVASGSHTIEIKGLGVGNEDVSDLIDEVSISGLPSKSTSSTSDSSTSNLSVTPISNFGPSTTHSTTNSGNPNGYDGWTWEQLLGSNWQNYITVKHTTSTSNKSTSTATTPTTSSSSSTSTSTIPGGTVTNSDGSTTTKTTTVVTTVTTDTSTDYVTTTNVNQTDDETITTLNVALVKQNLGQFPDTMPDGSWNPIKLAFGVGSPTPPSPVSTPVTTPSGGLVNLATFITLDHSFQVYFPNVGDFAQQPDLEGIGHITTTRGLGYVNNMDTTQYTKEKLVKFGFNVIFDGTLYPAETWISLPINQTYYDFYTVLANSEAAGAQVQFVAIPINGQPPSNPVNNNWVAVTNRHRFPDYSAYEGAYKKSYVDVVGRIGNFAVTDTGDYRSSNLFKQPLVPTQWMIDGLVKKVDPYQQNQYYGDQGTIRGNSLQSTGGFNLNTYGSQPWEQQTPLPLPVNPKDNPNPHLQQDFMKVGYGVYSTIQTIGDYQRGVVRVLPYYYKLNVDTGQITPLDVYEKTGSSYQPVNLYQGADNGTLPSNLGPYAITMDWNSDAPRMNYTLQEATISNQVAQTYGDNVLGTVTDPSGNQVLGVTSTEPTITPSGDYTVEGNAQRIVADETARTFIGSSTTNGQNEDPGNVLPEIQYNYEGQKWYFKIALPSSSVFVPAGDPVTQSNIKSVTSGNSVLLMAADIVSVGNVYTLRWNEPGVSSFTVTHGGVTKTFNVSQSGLPPVIALYSLNNTDTVDVTTQGTH